MRKVGTLMRRMTMEQVAASGRGRILSSASVYLRAPMTPTLTPLLPHPHSSCPIPVDWLSRWSAVGGLAHSLAVHRVGWRSATRLLESGMHVGCPTAAAVGWPHYGQLCMGGTDFCRMTPSHIPEHGRWLCAVVGAQVQCQACSNVVVLGCR